MRDLLQKRGLLNTLAVVVLDSVMKLTLDFVDPAQSPARLTTAPQIFNI